MMSSFQQCRWGGLPSQYQMDLKRCRGRHHIQPQFVKKQPLAVHP